jgi:hypothetical protein
MNITYNNLSSPSNILTFTEIPNILKISENVTGTKCTIQFSMNNGLRQTVSADSQYYITLFGETITNVMSPENAKNKRFYISDDRVSTAMSIARAFRNCGGLNADFDIFGVNGVVEIIAKTIGSKITTANYLQRNIPSQYMSVSVQDGSSYSALFNSKIDIDVYDSASANTSNYVTTLEKNWYGDECAFDVSPVLSTFSEYGQTKPYTFVINVFMENGEWQNQGAISGNTTVGYHANQSDKYKIAQGVQMLLNKSRGNDGTMILYTYNSSIPYSVLCGLNTGGWSVTVSVKDSAFNEIWNSGAITNRRTSSNMIIDGSVTIPQTAFTNGYYVDLTVGTETTRFNIIKPLKATEYYQRILWRNEYGGISFFDFTGARSESDSVDIETYEKNIFDYHNNDEFERKRIYLNDYKKTVTLTSHLMEEDGKWIFNSLMRSKKVWTTVNGKTYYIIPKSIDVAEDQTYNNIYTAKLQYEYSDI